MKYVPRMLLLAAALLAFPADRAAQAVNLVSNGAFEQTTNGNNQQAYVSTNPTGWSLTAINQNTASWGSGGTYSFVMSSPTVTVTSQIGGDFSMVAGTGSPDGGNLFAATSQSGTEGQQQLSQTINNLTPGNEYVLSFYEGLGQRSGYTGATSGSWEVTFGSENYTSPTDNNPSGGFTGWELRSTTFTASSASQVLMFVFNSSSLAGFPVGVLDGIVLAEPSPAPVPEIDPASFGSALALVVGALGILERRARKLLGAAVA
ncbi:MAG: hypothetical protein RLZZ326_3086 [Planctomycetota bacterium]